MESNYGSSSCFGSIQTLDNKVLDDISSYKSINIIETNSNFLSKISTSTSSPKHRRRSSKFSKDAEEGCTCEIF